MIMMINDDDYDVDEGVSSPICLVEAPATSKCKINTVVQCKCLHTSNQQGVHDEGTMISPLSKANSFSLEDYYCSVGGAAYT